MRRACLLLALLIVHSSVALDVLPSSIRYSIAGAVGVWVSYKLQHMPSLRVQYTHDTSGHAGEDTVHVTLHPYQYGTYSEPHTCNRAWAALTGFVLHGIIDTLVNTFLINRDPSFFAYLIGKNGCTLARLIYYGPFIDKRAVSDSFFYDCGSLVESGSFILDRIPYPDAQTFCR